MLFSVLQEGRSKVEVNGWGCCYQVFFFQLYSGTKKWLSSSSNAGKLDFAGFVESLVKNNGP